MSAVGSIPARRSGPQRTCVGCRVKAAKTDLLRVVAVEARPGEFRLTPDPRCLDLADKRRAFLRALRLAGPLDASPVREHVAAITTPDRSGSPR